MALIRMMAEELITWYCKLCKIYKQSTSESTSLRCFRCGREMERRG
jgi:hypothetical protein